MVQIDLSVLFLFVVATIAPVVARPVHTESPNTSSHQGSPKGPLRVMNPDLPSPSPSPDPIPSLIIQKPKPSYPLTNLPWLHHNADLLANIPPATPNSESPTTHQTHPAPPNTPVTTPPPPPPPPPTRRHTQPVPPTRRYTVRVVG